MRIAAYSNGILRVLALSPKRLGVSYKRSYNESVTNRSIESKRGLQLDRVVLLGRTLEEYRRYFLLEPHELIGKRVLDVAGGVSSFCAEANNLGIKVTAFDPIYSLLREKIREQSDPDLEWVYRSIDIVPTYRWGFYKNPDYMRAFVTFEAQPNEYIPMLKSDPSLKAFEFKEIATDFEFLVNSDSYLRVSRA